jgi:uncharacterized Zn finger protein
MKQKQDCLQGKNSTKANEWLVKKKKRARKQNTTNNAT